MESATLDVKGVKEKRYSKRTLCLSCYAAKAGEVNAQAVSKPRGLASYVEQLESGRCDVCGQNF